MGLREIWAAVIYAIEFQAAAKARRGRVTRYSPQCRHVTESLPWGWRFVERPAAGHRDAPCTPRVADPALTCFMTRAPLVDFAADMHRGALCVDGDTTAGDGAD